MKDILEETYGVMVYQEQVMRILQSARRHRTVERLQLHQGDQQEEAADDRQIPRAIHQGAVEQGLKEREADELFGMIEKFAGYGFNKSHSTAYALIAYMTAYLKAHFSVEFMAALLSGDIQGRNFKKKDSLVEHLEDCRRMNISVVSPDVNRCGGDFGVENGQILFGLAAIKGCGMQAAEAICAERKARGPFRDLFEFCERLDPRRSIAVRSNRSSKPAPSTLRARRSQNMAAIERALQSGASALADRGSGQKGLFGDDEEESVPAAASLPDLPEWPERDRLSAEKEVLGFYLSSHPLDRASGNAAQLLHAQHGRSHGAVASLRGGVGGHPIVDQVFADQESPARLDGDQVRDVRPGRHGRRDAPIIWPEEFANYSELIKADAIPGPARRDR